MVRAPISLPTLPRGLYLISDEGMIRRGAFIPFLEQALAAGLKTVQLRAKSLDPPTLEHTGTEMRRLTRRCAATFIVNDDPELAVRLEADGVHVGSGDASPEKARAILGPGRIVGLSTHNRDQVADAQSRPVDYIGVGPVFTTGSKAAPDPVVGVDFLASARSHSRLPVVAIGGITLENLEDVLQAGVHGVAVISAIVRAADPLGAVREFLERIAAHDRTAGA